MPRSVTSLRLCIAASDDQMCGKRRRATGEETLPVDPGPNATETQHAPYIDKSFDAELDEDIGKWCSAMSHTKEVISALGFP